MIYGIYELQRPSPLTKDCDPGHRTVAVDLILAVEDSLLPVTAASTPVYCSDVYFLNYFVLHSNPYPLLVAAEKLPLSTYHAEWPKVMATC
jgi:hypothetical protein